MSEAKNNTSDNQMVSIQVPNQTPKDQMADAQFIMCQNIDNCIIEADRRGRLEDLLDEQCELFEQRRIYTPQSPKKRMGMSLSPTQGCIVVCCGCLFSPVLLPAFLVWWTTKKITKMCKRRQENHPDDEEPSLLNNHSHRDIEDGKEETKKTDWSNMEKILHLSSTQTAAGVFSQDEVTIEMIGQDTVTGFLEQCKTQSISAEEGFTALVVAFIKENFEKEKDTWELFVKKSSDWVNNPNLLSKATDYLRNRS